MPLTRRCAALSAALAALPFALASAAANAAPPQRYGLDPVHTRVMFAVSHAGFSQALGTVSGARGSLLFDRDDWRSAKL
jgi:polyisoprenoid-binding protein YceI